jgi:hypothetical protein
MLKQTVSRSNAVEPDRKGFSRDNEGLLEPETDSESDLESRWLPVALCLALSDPEGDT